MLKFTTENSHTINRALVHVIKGEASRGIVKGDSNALETSSGSGGLEERKWPSTHSHSNPLSQRILRYYRHNFFRTLSLATLKAYPVLSLTSASQYHPPETSPSSPSLQRKPSNFCGTSGCVTLCRSQACFPQKGFILGELFLNPMSHSLQRKKIHSDNKQHRNILKY